MEEVVTELVKQSPGIGAIIAIVWIGMKWHERIATQWLAAIDKIDERGKLAGEAFVAAIKDIGEKCHIAHDKNAQMFYEQSCRGQEVLTNLTVNIALFAQAQKELSEAVKDFRRS